MPIPGVFKKVAEGQNPQRAVGTVENPKKFEGQDFNSIRETCLSRRQLFEDDTFPARLTSIGDYELLPQEKLLSIKWKRPKEIHRDPRFLVDGATRYDIIQGEIGDCWVLAAVGSLTSHRQFLENVIPKDQDFDNFYAGIFHFRFWQFGEWVEVVIDDRLPFLNSKYLSVQPRSSNEFWPSLLEKAYAKLRGSYQNLHWGYISEALIDFTGGVEMNFILTKPPVDLKDIVLAAARSGSLVACTTPGELRNGNAELPNGLIQGHAYTVTNTKQIEYNSKMEDIVQVWNPWGHGEWNGRWSDRSPQWEKVRPDIRSKLNVEKNDGEFWMSCQDFMQNFNQLSICNHTPSYMDFENQHFDWKLTSYFNQWIKGSTAGGSGGGLDGSYEGTDVGDPGTCLGVLGDCLTIRERFNKPGRRASPDDIWKNPQYVITVSGSEGEKRCYNVTVALMQSLNNKRYYKSSWLPIGFLFCRGGPKGVKNGPQQRYTRQSVLEVLASGLERSREVTRSYMAPPGTYVIIPFTEMKGQESEFLLRIFTKTKEIADSNNPKMGPREKSSTSYPSETSSSESDPRLNTQNPKAFLKQYQDFNYEMVFSRYANQRSEMYAEQLQRLLNDVIIKDQTFVADRGQFTLDACRGILILMDLNANGRLNLEEFGRLWKRLNMCKNLFRSIDVNHTGFLDGFGFRNAVQETGLTVSNDLLSVMVMRYANSSEKMTFCDFVSCMIRLETVTRVFKNWTKDGRGLYLTAEEWMQMVMSS